MTELEMKTRAMNVLGVKEDAEDAVQVAILKSLESGGEPEDYLEKSISEVRRSSVGAFHLGSNEVGTLEDLTWYLDENIIEDDVIDQIKLDELKATIKTMPKRQQQVLYLYCLDHQSHKQIAAEMKIRPQTSKNLLVRARARLLDLLSTQ